MYTFGDRLCALDVNKNCHKKISGEKEKGTKALDK